MSKTKEKIDAALLCSKSALQAEVEDAMWADFGRRVHQNLVGENMVKAINRAGLKCKGSTLHLTAMVRAYMLTGTLP